MEEVIDIGLEHIPSSNFGTGIELLMNDKNRSSIHKVNIDLGDLDNLEEELNELSSKNQSSSSFSNSTKNNDGKTLSEFASNLFGFDSSSSSKSNIKIMDPSNDSNLGNATKDTLGNNPSTWDGFSKMSGDANHYTANNATGYTPPSHTTLNDREKRRKKAMMIKKLEEWYEKGMIKNISHFNKDSVYEDVEDEYETALEDKRKKDSIKLHGWWFMTFVNSMEYANAAFNPFDINLDGWGEQVSEDIDSYDEIFGELHEKYKGGKLAPEISLLLRLGFSACIVNFTNKALSTATPGFNDVIRQSPELMKLFTNATVNTMNNQSPGFAFASNMMNTPDQINTSFGAPPAPIETKNNLPPQRPGSMQFTQAPTNRPDISSARGTMFREQGIDIHKSENTMMQQQPQQSGSSNMRAEMKGPQNSDIDHILSGLKTRTSAPSPQQTYEPVINTNYNAEDSMISISSLKDMQNISVPKRTNRRKQKSDKNTISLDI